MRFEDAHRDWQSGRLRQASAARLPGVCERTFLRCQISGLSGLSDKRFQVSHRRAPEEEVQALVGQYQRGHSG